jgi:hypothetical protein
VVAEPSGPKVPFIDTSQYRGHIDAEAVKASGKVGLFPRTTFRTSVDPLWFETATRALNAGLVCMARHRIYGSPSVADQFNVFVREAEKVRPGCEGLLVCLDSEDDATWSQVQEFEKRAFDRWGVWLVAYYPCWWLRGIGNPTLRKELTFWHSRYASEPGDLCGGRTTLKGQMWQYTQSGTCPGVSPPVDLNWFYGTEAELRALAVGAGGDSELTGEEDKWLSEIENAWIVYGTTNMEQTFQKVFDRVKETNEAFAVSGTTGPDQTWEILAARIRNIAAGAQALAAAQAPPPARGGRR